MGGCEARPPYPPRNDRSDSDRSEGHPSVADAHFSMTRSLTSDFSCSQRSAGTVTVPGSPSLTKRSCGVLSNHVLHEARSRSRTGMRGKRIGAQLTAHGEMGGPADTLRN